MPTPPKKEPTHARRTHFRAASRLGAGCSRRRGNVRGMAGEAGEGEAGREHLGRLDLGRGFAEDVGTQVNPVNYSAAFLIQTSHQRTVKAWLGAQGLSQVADRGAATDGEGGLVVRRKCGEIGAQGFHAPRIPVGKHSCNTHGSFTWR